MDATKSPPGTLPASQTRQKPGPQTAAPPASRPSSSHAAGRQAEGVARHDPDFDPVVTTSRTLQHASPKRKRFVRRLSDLSRRAQESARLTHQRVAPGSQDNPSHQRQRPGGAPSCGWTSNIGTLQQLYKHEIGQSRSIPGLTLRSQRALRVKPTSPFLHRFPPSGAPHPANFAPGFDLRRCFPGRRVSVSPTRCDELPAELKLAAARIRRNPAITPARRPLRAHPEPPVRVAA